MTEPEIIKVKAVDITPYEFGIWCSVGGSGPFVNDIVHRMWTDDGDSIKFCLDTFNFMSARYDELVRVVKLERPLEARKLSVFSQEKSEFLGRRPSPKQKCVTCGAVTP